MTSFINTNLGSINSQRHLNTSQASLSTSLERLSSGLRINNARDDAAGMSIAERFTSQIKGVNQAGRNANDGISMTQVAEGSLATTADALQRVRELAVQAANATNTAGDRKTIQDEVNQLLTEIDRTAQTTQFNGMNLMDGSASNMSFQVGANAKQTVSVDNANFRTNAYGSYRMGAIAAGTKTANTNEGDLLTGTSTQLGGIAGTAYTSVSSAAATNGIVADATQRISGSSGSTIIAVSTGDSAKTVAANINLQTQKTNVTASAVTQMDMTTLIQGNYSLAIVSNNTVATNISFSVSGATATKDELTTAATSFNAASSSTGVTAKLNDDATGITLTNASGENISLTSTAASKSFDLKTQTSVSGTLSSYTVAAGTTGFITGQLTLDSSNPFSVDAVGAQGSSYFTTTSSSAGLQAVNKIDVSSVEGATRSLKQIDAALLNIDAQRGLYGAMQSRFANAVSNLQSASENMSASRSRIQDTDFASETASLTRGQILQQAGTAMLAQANSLPNGVLALLRG